jgi:hypothetical protein
MKRTRITYKDVDGTKKTGYAILHEDTTDSEYVWCFDSKDAAYGFTLHTSDIIKVY